jgi:hypothetical protein
MKHAKRMVLVPEEVLDRFERKQRLETSPITSGMLQNDIQMSHILQHPDLDDDEKQKLYNASMERYLELRRQKDSQVPTVRFAPIKEEKNVSLPDAMVVETVPKRMRERATAIMNRLKTRPDIITWDNTGQVKIEGESIPQSNISDLVSDAVRARKNFTPSGSKEFFRALSKMNMPKDLVRNDERWKQESILSGDEEASTSRQRITRQSKRPGIVLSPKWQTY